MFKSIFLRGAALALLCGALFITLSGCSGKSDNESTSANGVSEAQASQAEKSASDFIADLNKKDFSAAQSCLSPSSQITPSFLRDACAPFFGAAQVQFDSVNCMVRGKKLLIRLHFLLKGSTYISNFTMDITSSRPMILDILAPVKKESHLAGSSGVAKKNPPAKS